MQVVAVWRDSYEADHASIVDAFVALNLEDPGPKPVAPSQMRTTLEAFRSTPQRGKALVLDVDGSVRGYALLVAFWSNEIGGEVCIVDELYVNPSVRGRGHAQALFDGLEALWARPHVAHGLETTPANGRARAFYERIGFDGANVAMIRRVPSPAPPDRSA